MILVVDDDPEIRSAIAEALDMEGYAVVTASDGVEGLAAVESCTPALVLLDMRMPRMDGWGLAAELGRRGISVPIAVLTAAADAHQWAREVGAVACLPKPFNLDDLLQMVGRCCEAAGASPTPPHPGA